MFFPCDTQDITENDSAEDSFLEFGCSPNGSRLDVDVKYVCWNSALAKGPSCTTYCE